MVIPRPLRLCIFAVLIIIGTAAPARTQGFISPLFGLNFGGVSGCPQLSDCENQQRNLSLSLGKFGSIFGAETEVAYSPKFSDERCRSGPAEAGRHIAQPEVRSQALRGE